MLAGIIVILPLLPAAREAAILFAHHSAAVLAGILIAEAAVCIGTLLTRIHWRNRCLQRKRASALATAIREEFS